MGGTQAWIIVLVTALCTFVFAGTVSLVFVSYCCRRTRRRRQAYELRLASIETVEQGLSQLSEKTPSDADVRSLNKSMRRLLPLHRIRVHARTSVWNFARPDLIGKLGFDKWQFECQNQPILSVATFTLSIFNRSTQPLRVCIKLQSSPDNGAGVLPSSPDLLSLASSSTTAHAPAAAMNSINLLHIESRAIECITLEVMPLLPGARCLFFAITPQSMEDDLRVDFAPYYLPLRIHAIPLTEHLKTYKSNELIGDKKPLGRGAAAVVYKRTIEATGLVVAVKQFAITNPTKMDVQEFLTEAKVLSRYSHPCVVQLLGVCTDFPDCSLILEYVPLGSLDRYVRPDDSDINEPPSWPLRIKFAIDGARALAYLHRMGVLHRDIKDANFLVSSLDPLQEVNLKLSDFSMSKDISGTKPSPRPLTIEETRRNNRLTLAGNGTVQWRAIEVMRGDAETKASDVWSFGVVLWQLATLKIPYSDTCKVFDIEKVVQSGKRLDLTRDTPSMPSNYPQVVQQCLQEDAHQRPTFDHLLDVLCDMQRRKGWWRVSSSAAIMRARLQHEGGEDDEDDEAFSEDESEDEEPYENRAAVV